MSPKYYDIFQAGEDLVVTGTANPKAKIKVNISYTTRTSQIEFHQKDFIVYSDSNGEYTFTFPKMRDGEYSVSVSVV